MNIADQEAFDSRPHKSSCAARAAILSAFLVVALALSYFFLDRQLAEALRPYTTGVPLFIWLTYIASPLRPIAAILAAVIAARALAQGRMSDTEATLLRMSCAILIACSLTYELKEVFGRTWPETWINNNPSYFGTGTYGFFPFHGGQGYRAFPSGHTTAIAALAGAAWHLWPKLRWSAAAIALAVAIGLIGANYHWLSDVIAGAAVGVATGMAAARIGRGDADTDWRGVAAK